MTDKERIHQLEEQNTALLVALERLEAVARSHCRNGEPGYDRRDVLAYCDEARALIARLRSEGAEVKT